MNELISVIVTTYDRPDALAAVLRGLAAQADRNFEVVIADDGSGRETQSTIESWRSRLRVPLSHVRQAHDGFRAAEIRNRAILAGHGAYCVFLDGDCIPRADFIAQHRRLAEPGWFVAGNRILLSEALTARVLSGELQPETWSLGALAGRWPRGVNRLAPALRLPLGPLRRAAPARWEGARTCNLAVARADLDRIDGFDASFSGWGLEDSDLAIRLLHAGVRRKDGRFATGVIHLWHPVNDRTRLAANRARLDEVIGGTRVRALRGLSTLAATAHG